MQPTTLQASDASTATQTATAFTSAGVLVGIADGSVRTVSQGITTTGGVANFPTVSVWTWACVGPTNPIAAAPSPAGW